MSWKILVVDDSRLARILVKNALVSAGFEVVGEAQNGKEAINLYSDKKPDLVTMDLVMPEIDGKQATEEIISKNPQANILMVTSINQDIMNDDLKKVGAKAIIAKPFEPENLVKAIHNILGPSA